MRALRQCPADRVPEICRNKCSLKKFLRFFLIHAPEDQLMAYQHTKRSNFITHKGVDKLFGARAMADFLHSDLQDSLGAGDTELDSFLSGVGLALLVGHIELPFAD